MSAVHTSGAGPWRPADTARPLYWWDERGLQALATALQDLLAQWCAAWGMACDAAVPRCRPAGQQPVLAARWLAFDAQAWLSLPEDKDAGLLRALFPDAADPGPLARAFASSCRQDAMARVAALLGLSCGEECAVPPFAALAQVGSGAVEADLSAPLAARLLLRADLAARWRTGPRDTTPRAR
ncbi:MAG: hypothetical protein JWQ76_2385, partial [Ramlibacter sp.]|nr:hypothetical protein [Ramlibacter sp.]